LIIVRNKNNVLTKDADVSHARVSQTQNYMMQEGKHLVRPLSSGHTLHKTPENHSLQGALKIQEY